MIRLIGWAGFVAGLLLMLRSGLAGGDGLSSAWAIVSLLSVIILCLNLLIRRIDRLLDGLAFYADKFNDESIDDKNTRV